jgi:Domain of unknown function (DUF1844)
MSMMDMDKEKKPEFVVTDRRKFTLEGEPIPGVESEEPKPAPAAAAPPPAREAQPAPPPAPAVAPANTAPAETSAPRKEPPARAAAPGPDLATGYNGERERTTFGGQQMEFIHLLDMLVQTAMMYAGAMDSGAERRVDIVGLRQMIDLIGVLQEKSRGNLNEQEEAMLKNTIFQLRMTYMEIASMIDRQAMQKAPGGPGPTRK